MPPRMLVLLLLSTDERASLLRFMNSRCLLCDVARVQLNRTQEAM